MRGGALGSCVIEGEAGRILVRGREEPKRRGEGALGTTTDEKLEGKEGGAMGGRLVAREEERETLLGARLVARGEGVARTPEGGAGGTAREGEVEAIADRREGLPSVEIRAGS